MALLVNSHHHMPWIVWKREYSIYVPQYGYINDQLLSHGLPFTPLLVGQWSTNPNFSPSYDLLITVPGGSTGGQVETVCSTSADSSNIHFTIVNNAAARTFYFRLMAFAPPDYQGEVSPVDYDSPFRFNSHYRYQQIYKSGRSTGTAVSHNLEYLPQARIWSITGSDQRVMPTQGILTTSTLSYAGSNTAFYYYIFKDRLDG